MSFPVAPTALGVLLGAIVIAYWLLRDHSANASLQLEIAGLRAAMDRQSARHHADVMGLHEKIGRLEGQYDEQRSAKHQALNDVAKMKIAISIVRRLQRECTCGALDPLGEILANLAAHGDIP